MMTDLIRYIVIVTLLCFSYKQAGWAVGLLLTYFFLQGEAIFYILRNRLPEAFKNKKITESDIHNLKFSTDPLNLQQIILIQQTANGDYAAFKEFLKSRCLDKNFDFGLVSVDLLNKLADKFVNEISNQYEEKPESLIIKSDIIH